MFLEVEYFQERDHLLRLSKSMSPEAAFFKKNLRLN